jgi:hypothetical protein
LACAYAGALENVVETNPKVEIAITASKPPHFALIILFVIVGILRFP